MWNWYKKNRKWVSFTMLAVSTLAVVLNGVGMIVKPDVLGAIATVASLIATVLWLSVVMEFLS